MAVAVDRPAVLLVVLGIHEPHVLAGELVERVVAIPRYCTLSTCGCVVR